MVVDEANIHNIMGGLEGAGGIKQHKKKLRQRFDIIRKLGQGTFGKVQLGVNKETGQEVAIKTIKKSKIETEADLVRIRREIQIMSSVQHPNIIHIYEVFENREKMVLVMEYAAGGELYDYLSERKVLPEEEARRIFRQIATACYYCHKHKICHRDLKLENILLDESNNAKIADFGLSNVFDDQRLLSTFCGSPLYASPEIVNGTPYCGPEVDCWSLGVLLYTLVYGAMPFDGSNFKRLVKQISNADYVEPAKPSSASALIRIMLAVDATSRADIEKVCSHWWVNRDYDTSCLDISQDLTNQTPVRLDLLLSLAPPPDNDKLMVTSASNSQNPVNLTDVSDMIEKSETMMMCADPLFAISAVPARSQSLGNVIMETAGFKDVPAATSQKRKLDIVSSRFEALDSDSVCGGGGDRPPDERKDQKISKEKTVDDVTKDSAADSMVVEGGAACLELLQEEKEDAIRNQQRQEELPCAAVSIELTLPEVVETLPQLVVDSKEQQTEDTKKAAVPMVTPSVIPVQKPKKKLVKKKVSTDKSDSSGIAVKSKVPKSTTTSRTATDPPAEDATTTKATTTSTEATRRRSRIFEAAEKFQTMIQQNNNWTTNGTPTTKEESTSTKTSATPPTAAATAKRLIIPGVSVDGFKREFERKASLTPKPSSVSVRPAVRKCVSIDGGDTNENRDRVKNAVNIISSALDREGTRKLKPRLATGATTLPVVPAGSQVQPSLPPPPRKPPIIPFGSSGRSSTGTVGLIPLPTASSTIKSTTTTKGTTASNINNPLKSATLPRLRKTTKAEIQLNYPQGDHSKEIKTEMTAAPGGAETTANITRMERIIPIQVEADGSAHVIVPTVAATKPPQVRRLSSTTTNNSSSSSTTRSASVTRPSQSLDSESDASTTTTTTVTGEPIRKSPREYIIPIAVEGGGYITPRASSLDPPPPTQSLISGTTENASRIRSKFAHGRRLNSMLGETRSSVTGDSDGGETSLSSPFHHRLHSSRDQSSDRDESSGATPRFHMHRLRSTRPKRTATLEPTDSMSSAEDDDDDDGFEILTAENLFSTLLQRVRDLTQRLNDDNRTRPGFPTSRLLSRFDHGTNFWNNRHLDHQPLTRQLSTRRDQNSSSNNTCSNNNENIATTLTNRSATNQHEFPSTTSVPHWSRSSRTTARDPSLSNDEDGTVVTTSNGGTANKLNTSTQSGAARIQYIPMLVSASSADHRIVTPPISQRK